MLGLCRRQRKPEFAVISFGKLLRNGDNDKLSASCGERRGEFPAEPIVRGEDEPGAVAEIVHLPACGRTKQAAPRRHGEGVVDRRRSWRPVCLRSVRLLCIDPISLALERIGRKWHLSPRFTVI